MHLSSARFLKPTEPRRSLSNKAIWQTLTRRRYILCAELKERNALAALTGFDDRMSDLIQFATTVHVSEEVRTECEAELAAAKKNGYRIPKNKV